MDPFIVICAAAIGALPSILVALLSIRSAKERMLYDNSMQLAIKSWEMHLKIAKDRNIDVDIATLDTYLIYNLAVMKGIDSGRIKKRNAKEKIKEIHDTISLIQEANDEHYASKNTPKDVAKTEDLTSRGEQ